MITTIVETITPKRAQELLDAHLVEDRQRRVSTATVDAYARAMKSGQWMLTHQGIAISDEGELIDGQHRLKAVVESGVTVDMMVTRGLPDSVAEDGDVFLIDHIDRGYNRRVGQQLRLRHGVANSNTVASVCRGVLWLCAYSQGKAIGRNTVPNALRTLDVYGPEIRYCVDNRSYDYRVRNAAPIAASAFAMKGCDDQESIRGFYHQLTTGEMMQQGDPAMACRRWLMNSADKAGQLTEYRAVLTCAMKHVEGESHTRIYDTENGYNYFLDRQREDVTTLLRLCGFDA